MPNMWVIWVAAMDTQSLFQIFLQGKDCGTTLMTSLPSSFQPRNAKKIDKETNIISNTISVMPRCLVLILLWYTGFISFNNKLFRIPGGSVSLQHCQRFWRCLQFKESYIVHFCSKQCYNFFWAYLFPDPEDERTPQRFFLGTDEFVLREKTTLSVKTNLLLRRQERSNIVAKPILKVMAERNLFQSRFSLKLVWKCSDHWI